MSRSLRAALDESNPNKIAAVLAAVRAGAAFGAIPQFYRGAVAADALVLPETLRASMVLDAFSVAGTLTGRLTPVKTGAVPASGQVNVGPTGNISFAAADAVTEAEVLYVPWQGQLYEDFVPVAASVALFAQGRKGLLLLEAEVLTGIIPGSKAVDYRAAAVAAGEADLRLDGTGVTFNAAAVVTGTARLKYYAQPGVGNGPAKSLAHLLTDLQSAL